MMIFFAIMGILTITVRKIHIASLPKVTIGYLEMTKFEENSESDTKDEGIQSEYRLGLPKAIYECQPIYVISKETVNGEERDIARKVEKLEVGRENGQYYEVLNGITSLEPIIVSGMESVQDGSEVFIEE